MVLLITCAWTFPLLLVPEDLREEEDVEVGTPRPFTSKEEMWGVGDNNYLEEVFFRKEISL